MKCQICGSNFNEYDKYYKCSDCGFISKKTFISSLEEKERYLAHVYDENYTKYQENLLKDILSPLQGDILDFGCGREPVLDKLFSNLSFTYYDLYFYDSDYKKKSYNYILLNEVIEHIRDPLTTLFELNSLLKEGGSFIIHTMLQNKDTDIDKWWYFRDKTHISFFSEDSFKEVALKLNLKLIVEKDFIFLKKAL